MTPALGTIYYTTDAIGSHRYAMRMRNGRLGADFEPVDVREVLRRATAEEDADFNATLISYGEKRAAKRGEVAA